MDLSFNEHLIIFISVIYAFFVTIIYAGWGRMIRTINKSTIPFLYIGWTILVKLFIVQTWWENFQIKEEMALHIGYFYLVLIALILLYFTIFYMFPDNESIKDGNYDKYFFENKAKIFLSAIGYLFMLMIISSVFKKINFFAWENILRLIAIITLGAATVFNNRKVQTGILIALVLILGIFVTYFRWRSGN